MSEPSNKRKRPENSISESDSADAAPVRSKIWMPYGDIILQAESTQFRVNRDVLAQQSSVFRDMFSVPQPANEPMVDGCPVVHVSDTAPDWELFLDVIYHPFQSDSIRPFNVVASMLRLGKKYDIREAKEDAVSRIHFEFPCDLETWSDSASDLQKISYQDGVYADLLHLVYECGVYSSIPSLAKTALRNDSLETLLTGVPRQDGSRVNLSEAVKLTLVIAAERMLFFQRNSLSWLNGETVIPHTDCEHRGLCTQEKMVMNHTVLWSAPTDDTIDLTYVIDHWDEEWSGKLCSACEEAARAFYETSRIKGWALLPSFFGLPAWDELKALETST